MLEEGNVRRAVVALLKHIENQQSSQKNSLLEKQETISIIIALRKIPEKGRRCVRISFPNPTP